MHITLLQAQPAPGVSQKMAQFIFPQHLVPLPEPPILVVEPLRTEPDVFVPAAMTETCPSVAPVVEVAVDVIIAKVVYGQIKGMLGSARRGYGIEKSTRQRAAYRRMMVWYDSIRGTEQQRMVEVVARQAELLDALGEGFEQVAGFMFIEAFKLRLDRWTAHLYPFTHISNIFCH